MRPPNLGHTADTNVARGPEWIIRQPVVSGLAVWILTAESLFVFYPPKVRVTLDLLVRHDLKTCFAHFHGGVAFEVEAVGGEVAALGLEVANPLATVFWLDNAGTEIARSGCLGEVALVFEGEVRGDLGE